MFSLIFFELNLPFARLQEYLEALQRDGYSRHKTTALVRDRLLEVVTQQLEEWQSEWERLAEEADEIYESLLMCNRTPASLSLWPTLRNITAHVDVLLDAKVNTSLQTLKQNLAEVYIDVHSELKKCTRLCTEAERKLEGQVAAAEARFLTQRVLGNANGTRLRHPRRA